MSEIEAARTACINTFRDTGAVPELLWEGVDRAVRGLDPSEWGLTRIRGRDREAYRATASTGEVIRLGLDEGKMLAHYWGGLTFQHLRPGGEGHVWPFDLGDGHYAVHGGSEYFVRTNAMSTVDDHDRTIKQLVDEDSIRSSEPMDSKSSTKRVPVAALAAVVAVVALSAIAIAFGARRLTSK